MSIAVPRYLDPDPKGLDLTKTDTPREMSQAVLQTAPKTGPPEHNDDSYRFWRFKDLFERGIVSSRPDLFEKQQRLNFPRPIHFSGGRMPAAHYKVAEVKAWLREREAMDEKRSPAGPAIPAVPRPEAAVAKRPRGRPRKVQRDHLEAAE